MGDQIYLLMFSLPLQAKHKALSMCTFMSLQLKENTIMTIFCQITKCLSASAWTQGLHLITSKQGVNDSLSSTGTRD